MESRRARIYVMVIVSTVFYCGLPKLFGALTISDGQIHNIDYRISDSLWVDFLAPGIQTTVNLLDGSRIDYMLEAYEDSRVNFVGEHLGRMGLRAYDRSQAQIYAGWVGRAIQAWDNTKVDMSGGIFFAELASGNLAVITVHGSDFAVDGEPVGYGELRSVLGGYPYDDPVRHLTGTLANGEPIDNDFHIGNDATIVLVPEPATLFLLGLGGLDLLRKRRML